MSEQCKILEFDFHFPFYISKKVEVLNIFSECQEFLFQFSIAELSQVNLNYLILFSSLINSDSGDVTVNISFRPRVFLNITLIIDRQK